MTRPRLLVATSFPVHPPRGGGQQRIAGLYSALARLGVDVEIVSLVGFEERGGRVAIAPGVCEWRVPMTAEHHRAEYALHMRAGVPVRDLALALHPDLTPAYGDALAAAAESAVATVASHPFAQPALAESTALPLIYEAHNVETDLKASMLADSDAAEALAGAVRAIEGACCATAAHTMVCSEADGARLGELFGLPQERVVVVPNGVDPGAFPFVDAELRSQRRRALGLGDAPLALFLGSWHEPNLAAVRDVLAAAEALPETRFLVVGSAGLAFADEAVPRNVDLCGIVDGGFVRSVLGLADAALNPMRWGSGTNLKMLDYALAGVPILSTEFGARGLGLEPGVHYEAIEADELAAGLEALRALPERRLAERTRAAAERVGERFAWDAIAARWHAHPALRELLEGAAVA
jgi:glycosyltransferase involved in cell wall biosynthesis